MYECIVKPKSIQISDPGVLETMARNNVRYVSYSLIEEGNGEPVIVARMPDNAEDLTLGKSWMSVHYNRNVWTRTPKILQGYAGQRVLVYTEQIFKEPYELFRIRSLGFSFGETRQRKQRVKVDVPYFTKSGIVVIPRNYINKYLNSKAAIARLSFNMVNELLISQGYLWAHFTIGDERGKMLYPLHQCTNGLRTRTPVNLIDRVANQGKDLSRYQYFTTVGQESFEYGVIVFEEIKDV